MGTFGEKEDSIKSLVSRLKNFSELKNFQKLLTANVPAIDCGKFKFFNVTFYSVHLLHSFLPKNNTTKN